MPRDFKLYLEDILECIDSIALYTRGMDPHSFQKDRKTYDAVLRNLTIIGEAAKQMPKDMREKLADVPWKEICGMRDVLIHHYFGVEEDTLWDVIQCELPILRKKVEGLKRGD